ncbi:PTS sugar transporter subunit IIA [uncultured Vagococcus sp.]|uniref:PTS sugar transporter subunit IIA n=1 Tax=uncultured Vagococcus sp. TaxID=189676 RepID=UPI0028D3B6C3|nr:PTS sugar transporter subunit IIA [uncultured Vagococcus sp.]
MAQSDLNKLLTRERIKHVRSVSTWEEATEMASQPLVSEGAIEECYVENMKQNVLVNGPYMVLTDYFALMHSKAGEGVKEMAMSLLITDQAVDMAGVPVKLFLILAAIDNQAHIGALAQITTILMNKELFDTFLRGDVEEILKIINDN